jgi:predicted secreted acid phosphatase
MVEAFRHNARLPALLLCFAMAIPAVACASEDDIFSTSPYQPQNVGDAITAAAAYHDSGEYERDITLVAGKAADWIGERAPQTTRPAVVFDIDETALANWEVIKRDNFGRPIQGPCDMALDGPCGWAAWDNLAKDPPIGPTLSVFKQALASKADVFFITGRPENQRQATEENLRTAGYVGYVKLYMVPDNAQYSSAVNFKAPIRAEIESAGYKIIANIGDQPSDLLGGYAERMFLLPNPFYRVR